MTRSIGRVVVGVSLSLASLALSPLAHAREEPEKPVEVSRGQMSEEAARAAQLFSQKKWAVAAMALNRVVQGDTGDHLIDRQIAAYRLAVSLYRLHFYQASLDRFRAIAATPRHPRRIASLVWFARLDTRLPEPANVMASLRHYSARELARHKARRARTRR